MQIGTQVAPSNKVTATQIPDLYTNECPVGCKDCKGIYLNDQIHHRIVCKCPCHPLTEENQWVEENDLQSASSVASPKRQAAVTSKTTVGEDTTET